MVNEVCERVSFKLCRVLNNWAGRRKTCIFPTFVSVGGLAGLAVVVRGVRQLWRR